MKESEKIARHISLCLNYIRIENLPKNKTQTHIIKKANPQKRLDLLRFRIAVLAVAT